MLFFCQLPKQKQKQTNKPHKHIFYFFIIAKALDRQASPQRTNQQLCNLKELSQLIDKGTAPGEPLSFGPPHASYQGKQGLAAARHRNTSPALPELTETHCLRGINSPSDQLLVKQKLTASLLKGQDSQTLLVMRIRGKDKNRHPFLCVFITVSPAGCKSPSKPSPRDIGHILDTHPGGFLTCHMSVHTSNKKL